MRSFKQEQLEGQQAEIAATLAKTLAPEDVRPGDFVTRLLETVEYSPLLWCADASTLSPDVPIRTQFFPSDSGIPMKVKSVCLPFVLVQHARGGHTVLDMRQCHLARLDAAYAGAFWKALKKKGTGKKAKRKGK